MALFSGNHRLSVLTLLSALLLATARLDLDPSDLKAFSILQEDFGQQATSSSPCEIAGVYCERRLSTNTNTYVLRITRLLFKSLHLRGVLSPEIGRLSELRVLSLADNNLVGGVPPQLADCKKLEVLDLGKNQFSGEIPTQISSLVRLRVIDLCSNQFSGKLSFLKYFPNLETLSLADNLFSGAIPQLVRSFRNLQVFNISGNDLLEGPVPVMRKVNLSSTHLPKRYLYANSNSSSITRTNASSPAPALAPTPGPSAELPLHEHKHFIKKLAKLLPAFLAGALAGSISGFVIAVLFRLLLIYVRGREKDHGPAIFSPLIKKAEDLAFLEEEDGLAALEMIGKGGCGEVYMAELPGSGGKLIAIKKIIQPPKDAADLVDEDTKQLDKKMRQIKSEIQTVGQIRHRNLLPLLAHVSRPDCHLLVYEFMKNGSLQDTLTQVSAGLRDLDWPARHKIAVGIATGLEYLHINHSPCIIHRDLKPANILLDDDMEARIADFGLAQAMPDAHTHITASNVAGTLGYIAPEYHQTMKFTDKCDIYSFGVVLGVLVMGKMPSDEFFQHTAEMSLTKWMKNVMASENLAQAIDGKLAGNGYEEQMLLVLKIACFCTQEDMKQRPDSKDVRCMLTQIVH